MGRVEDLLLLEKAGELPASMQKDLDTLRAAGEVPPLQGAAPVEESADMVMPASKTTGPHGTQAGQRVFDAIQPYVGGGVAAGAATATDLVGQAAKGIIPTAGMIGGAALGAPAGPGGALIGGSAGSAVGEGINQALGITEPSLAQIGLAGAAPGVGAGAMGLLRQGGGIAAKMFGGRQVIASQAAAVAKEMFSPPIPSQVLYERVAQNYNNIAVVPTKTVDSINKILNEEAKNLPTEVSESIMNAVIPFVGKLTGATQDTRVKQAAIAVRDLQHQARTAYASKNSRLGDAMTAIRNAMMDDVEDVGVAALREASKAHRKQIAVKDLDSIIHQAQPLKAYEAAMQKNSLFSGSFSAAEHEQIKTMLTRLTTVAPSGSSGVLGRAITTMAGAQLGGAAGAVGGAIVSDVTAYALSSAAGRKFLQKLLVGNVWDAPKAAALATFVRGQMAEDAKNGEVAESVKALLKDKDAPFPEKVQAAVDRDRMMQSR
jgi:hypothetical protein